MHEVHRCLRAREVIVSIAEKEDQGTTDDTANDACISVI